MKKTPWFPPDVKPVHVGPYECRACGGSAKHLWDGRRFLFSVSKQPVTVPFEWRGLAEKPKGE